MFTILLGRHVKFPDYVINDYKGMIGTVVAVQKDVDVLMLTVSFDDKPMVTDSAVEFILLPIP